MHYLRNSQEIKKQIGSLFSGAEKKWAIVGFVGYNALDHLPSGVENLSIICWPKAGGTHPDGIRRLIDKGISVYFCDRLHQKIYWKNSKGLIIGSANLSDNALGEGGLHEFAVYCEDNTFDIEKVISALKHTAVTPEALAKLDIEHAAQSRRRADKQSPDPTEPQSFLEYRKTAYPRKWKIVTWSEIRKDNTEIRKEVEIHFKKNYWTNDNDIEQGDFNVGDFVIQLKINDEGIVEKVNPRWFFVDHIVGKGKKRAIIQVNKLDNKTPPPFLIDSTFQKHLKKSCNDEQHWKTIYDENCFARPAFIDSIAKQYKNLDLDAMKDNAST
ncbi:MAG: phospholipase D family protein [Pseudomonadales bacterium]